MTTLERRQVFYVYPPLFQYRAPFHERVREYLAREGIDYHVLYCEPSKESLLKKDTVELPWAIKTPISYVSTPVGKLVYQGALPFLRSANLIIMQQENKQLLNYILLLRRLWSPAKVAYFGHGRNFQSNGELGLAARLKRFLATKVDWWFAYNDLSARVVESYGFPAERITSFRNAIDMKLLSSEISRVTRDDLAARRAALNLTSENVGVFVGGIYSEKRVAFLLEAAKRIRSAVPDFELLVIGGGPEYGIVSEAARTHPYIRALGPKYGREKTELALLGNVFLMPGLVGLAVLDAFAYNIPMFTTDYPLHSPEIDYLKHGINGWIARPWQEVDAYAEAVVTFLVTPELRKRLSHGAAISASEYSIEDMATRFTKGVLSALALS